MATRAVRRRGWALRTPMGVAIVLTLLFVLLPILWMIDSSFKGPSVINTRTIVPWPPSATNYRTAFLQYTFARYIVNSVVVSVLTTAVVLVLGTLAGYALARTPMRGKFPILVTLLMISVFPAIAVVAPLYLIMRNLSMLNSYEALILPYAAFNLPFSIWILRNYFLGVPKEMEETARIDGASPLRTVWSIVLPQTLPGLFTAGIFTFTACWTEFLMSLSFNSNNSWRTIPVGIALFGSQFTVPYGPIFAASCVAAVPIAALVLIFRKSVVSGLTSGAVKG